MCDLKSALPVNAKEAGRKLAELMQRQMEVDIDPIALRLFLRAHWSKVSVLAHQIHEADD